MTSKVLPIDGQGRQAADTFSEPVPPGFEIAWMASGLADEEKIEHLRDVEFAAPRPATMSGALMRGAGFPSILNQKEISR